MRDYGRSPRCDPAVAARSLLPHSFPDPFLSCPLFSRNQLWFIYVFASAREQFENGPLQQADSVRKTVRRTTIEATKRTAGLCVCGSSHNGD